MKKMLCILLASLVATTVFAVDHATHGGMPTTAESITLSASATQAPEDIAKTDKKEIKKKKKKKSKKVKKAKGQHIDKTANPSNSTSIPSTLTD